MLSQQIMFVHLYPSLIGVARMSYLNYSAPTRIDSTVSFKGNLMTKNYTL